MSARASAGSPETWRPRNAARTAGTAASGLTPGASSNRSAVGRPSCEAATKRAISRPSPSRRMRPSRRVGSSSIGTPGRVGRVRSLRGRGDHRRRVVRGAVLVPRRGWRGVAGGLQPRRRRRALPRTRCAGAAGARPARERRRGAARHHAEALADDAVGRGGRSSCAAIPDNPHDANAIAVHVPGGLQVGWVPRELAAELAPELDAGRQWSAVSLRDSGRRRGRAAQA